MAAKLARSQRSQVQAPGASSRSLVQVGELLAGKYRVERVVGEGGMGVVVAGRHELLDQPVAVKLLCNDVADRETKSRLVLEARACAKLQSDHVARVMDVDTGPDGLPFIVMELLDGSDLSELSDQHGPLPCQQVVDWVLQALEGLAHAHVRGIVHRDLKPSNLFLTNRPDGSQIIKILDFGISKSAEALEAGLEHRRMTGGILMGSPPYMSPEQVRSPKGVDHRTDIWSLGICLYELLTNAMPFGGATLKDTFDEILTKNPEPIHHLAPSVPPGLEHVVLECLTKDRAFRYADVAELARALVPYGSGQWEAAPSRIEGTLARGFSESGSKRSLELLLDGLEGERVVVTPVPRALESNQELLASANTLARPFTLFEKRTLWLVGVPALLGVVIAGASIYHAQALASSEEEGQAVAGSRASPSAPVPSAAPASSASSAVAHEPPPAGSASVAPAGSITKPAASASATIKKASAESAGRSALPAGLPRDRQ